MAGPVRQYVARNRVNIVPEWPGVGLHV